MTKKELEAIAEKSANISFLAWDLVNGELPQNQEGIDGADWQQEPQVLHTNFIFVGLNPSGKVDRLTNLHRKHDEGNNLLRHAVFRIQFWGSIFMDIEPNVIESKSENVSDTTDDGYNASKNLLKSILQTLPLANDKPIQLVAFGNSVFNRLKKVEQRLSKDLNREIIIHKVWHYSPQNTSTHKISDEDYDKMFRDFSNWQKCNPGKPFVAPPVTCCKMNCMPS